MDQHAIHRGRHAGEVQQRHDQRNGHLLERRFEPFTEGHGEEGIGQRKEERAADMRPQNRHHRALQRDHQPEMTRGGDAGSGADQPSEPARRDQQQPGPPRDRGHRRERLATRPDEPADHRQDEKTMAVGGAGPPQGQQIGNVVAKQQQDGGSRRRQGREVRAPHHRRHSNRAVNHGRHTAARRASRSSSGASRASQP